MTSFFDSDAFNGALFYPQAIASPPPPGATDHFIDVDRARLHLRVYGQHAHPITVLYFHGNGEVVADYDGVAPLFAAHADAALAVVDYRGYGQSTGRPTLRDAIADAHAVLAALAGEALVVMGRSLGGASAAELCQVARPRVRGYVFESAAADLAGVVARRGLRDVPSADDRAVFDPLPKVARCSTPALILHGEADTLIRVSEAEQTHAALPGSRLVRIPGRGHNDVSDHPLYWRALGEFVRAVR